ncbi:uncharacterized protein LOC131938628 [Physella acuta]|uniref:uncharacterized protein LOC131938628 n=1 Tax=Physella acuta TaxID=109671 RepID=UPI0027DB56C0|nr:uncharacterized protein LOC131938628 [Physella acuta]
MTTGILKGADTRQVGVPAVTIATSVKVSTNERTHRPRLSRMIRVPFEGCRKKTLKCINSRPFLITICVLVVVECACVLAELMVDLQGIKFRFENEENEINRFVLHLREKFPEAFANEDMRSMSDVINVLEQSFIFRTKNDLLTSPDCAPCVCTSNTTAASAKMAAGVMAATPSLDALDTRNITALPGFEPQHTEPLSFTADAVSSSLKSSTPSSSLQPSSWLHTSPDSHLPTPTTAPPHSVLLTTESTPPFDPPASPTPRTTPNPFLSTPADAIVSSLDSSLALLNTSRAPPPGGAREKRAALVAGEEPLPGNPVSSRPVAALIVSVTWSNLHSFLANTKNTVSQFVRLFSLKNEKDNELARDFAGYSTSTVLDTRLKPQIGNVSYSLSLFRSENVPEIVPHKSGARGQGVGREIREVSYNRLPGDTGLSIDPLVSSTKADVISGQLTTSRRGEGHRARSQPSYFQVTGREQRRKRAVGGATGSAPQTSAVSQSISRTNTLATSFPITPTSPFSSWSAQNTLTTTTLQNPAHFSPATNQPTIVEATATNHFTEPINPTLTLTSPDVQTNSPPVQAARADLGLNTLSGLTPGPQTISPSTDSRVSDVTKTTSASPRKPVTLEDIFVLQVNNIIDSFFLVAEFVPSHADGNGTKYLQYVDEYSKVYKSSKALHFVSLSILSVMVLETAIKLFCTGCAFLKKRFEVFDAFIVVSSFALDFVFLDSRWYETGKDATTILVLLLPWRVVRIVNSFLMTMKHKHHIQMMNMKRARKKAELKAAKLQTLLSEIRKDVQLLVALCRSHDVEEKDITACLYGKGRRSVTLSAMSTCTSLMLISTLGKDAIQEDDIYGKVFKEALNEGDSTELNSEIQQAEEAAIDAAIELDEQIEARRKSKKYKSKKTRVKRSYTVPRRTASVEIPEPDINENNSNIYYINDGFLTAQATSPRNGTEFSTLAGALAGCSTVAEEDEQHHPNHGGASALPRRQKYQSTASLRSLPLRKGSRSNSMVIYMPEFDEPIEIPIKNQKKRKSSVHFDSNV